MNEFAIIVYIFTQYFPHSSLYILNYLLVKKIWCKSRFGRNGALWSIAANLHVVIFESIQMNCMIVVRHSEFWGLQIQTHFGNSIEGKVTRLYEY